MLNVDEIYIINLKRRPDRKVKLKNHLEQINLGKHIFIEAIDGNELNLKVLQNQGIRPFNGWKLPYQFKYKKFSRYYFRDITLNEIACTLSHKKIWDKIIKDKVELALILEDDAFFSYKESITFINQQTAYLESKKLYWDFLYLGRQPMENHEMDISPHLVIPKYSWLSHAYIISKKGAEKLSNNLLMNYLIPVDEYLPLMMGSHPRKDIADLYSGSEKIIAYALRPEMVKQSFSGKISDIESNNDF